MAQPGIEISNRGEDADGAISILNVGGMDLQPDQVAERVDDDVKLPEPTLREFAAEKVSRGGLAR